MSEDYLAQLADLDRGPFAWVNRGAATVRRNPDGGVALWAPAAASDNLRVRAKAKANPYRLTVGLVPRLTAGTNAFGLCWVQQGTPVKLATLNVYQDTISVPGAAVLFLGISKYNSPTSYSASYDALPVDALAFGQKLWLRLEDDGARRRCSWSSDGHAFTEVHAVARTNFLTPDGVGVFADAYNATYGSGGVIYSWEETDYVPPEV